MENPIDVVKDAAIATEADAINRLQTVASNLIDKLSAIANGWLPLLDNEVRGLQVLASDERKALIKDLHGVIDRLEGLTVTVSVHVPPRNGAGE